MQMPVDAASRIYDCEPLTSQASFETSLESKWV
jgi:hypothetical protein